ncbi:MAG: hypothetical protein ACKVVP_07950 [Chloroflexota bacterium]
MIRTLLVAGVSSLATAALFMSGFLSRPHGMAVDAAFAQPFAHDMFATQLPPELRGLGQLAPAERFKHFTGVQATFTDVNNVAHRVTIVPGKVQSVTADTLTIVPNDAALGAAKSYMLTADTIIRKPAQAWASGRSENQISVGDTVMVVALDGDQPRAIIVGGPDGFRPRHHIGRGGA